LLQIGRLPAALTIASFLFAASAGCLPSSNLPAPGEVLERKLPDLNREYHMYVPTRYHRDRPLPLIITCHGTNPWDSVEFQIEEWKGLAEQKKFIIAAPYLIGTDGTLPTDPREQISRLTADEKVILETVRMIRAGYSVNTDQIFITGWSAGSYAALFTGLRHPDIFRAVSIQQGQFKAAYFEPCVAFLDRYQPVQILSGNMDILDNSEDMIEWFREHDMRPQAIGRVGGHRRDLVPVYGFFADVVRNRPWIRVMVRVDSDPMTVGFRARTSFEPTSMLWDFGDQQRSSEPAPTHTFTEPGLYTVKVALWSTKSKYHIRHLSLKVPQYQPGTSRSISEATP
jgi:pimeloyl-ACP methyl ester carboxylesterase